MALRHRARIAAVALIAPALALAALGVLYPLLLNAIESVSTVEAGQRGFAWILDNTVYIDILVRTFITAFLTVAICIALAVPYAYGMVLAGPALRLILLAAVLLPFWISGLVRVFAWLVLFQPGGPLTHLPFVADGGLLGTRAAVQIALVQVLLPFMVLPLYNAMRKVDPHLMTAAEGLGASRTRAFWSVFMPLSLPGVLAGGLIVFVLSLGFYVLPQLLGSPEQALIGEVIFTQVNSLGNSGRAGALSVTLLLAALVVMAVIAGAARALPHAKVRS